MCPNIAADMIELAGMAETDLANTEATLSKADMRRRVAATEQPAPHTADNRPVYFAAPATGAETGWAKETAEGENFRLAD